MRKRSAMAVVASCANAAKSAFVIAPSNAETAKRRRTLSTSARFAMALISVPATNPSCTASVSHDVVAGVRCHSLAIFGATADAVNQSDMPRSSARPVRIRGRVRVIRGKLNLGA